MVRRDIKLAVRAGAGGLQAQILHRQVDCGTKPFSAELHDDAFTECRPAIATGNAQG